MREQWREGLEPPPPWLPAQNKPLPIFLVFKLQSGLTRNCSSRRHVHCQRLPVCTDVARSIRARSVRSLVAHDRVFRRAGHARGDSDCIYKDDQAGRGGKHETSLRAGSGCDAVFRRQKFLQRLGQYCGQFLPVSNCSRQRRTQLLTARMTEYQLSIRSGRLETF